jgi:hypothetical protein
VRNPNDSEGRWKIGGLRQTIYGKASMTENERLAAAFKLTGTRLTCKRRQGCRRDAVRVAGQKRNGTMT